ncbi:MAG TPA: dihydroorotate dehydrogenase electron transfer subunit [Clostridia bacterium]|nr:dihydroorotate dehydrogenase electron transfer subunit [Clostridia bacterium]
MLRYEVRVLENYEIANFIYKMTLDAGEIAQRAQPGQFVHIKIPEDASLLLRRPISINGVDLTTGQVDLIYQVVGKGTNILSGVKKDTKLDVLGPLGRGFWIPEGCMKLYIVGGGCGVAPIKFIGQRFGHLDITSFLGFRSRSAAYQIQDFESFSREVFISTDDGSMGEKGPILHSLRHKLSHERPDIILACGPVPMLKILQSFVAEHDIPCQISLEERMGCGVGGCMVCSCEIGDDGHRDYKKVCADGPVFWSEEVLLG